ncbi:MAG: substrate-binding domain-containing protein [Betaproteobacteria bacterium]
MPEPKGFLCRHVEARLLALALVAGILLAAALGTAATAAPAAREVILATTTSTQDTGLLDVLVPMFESETGYIVKTIAVGTGQALALGARGEADVLLCHAPESEMELVKSGLVTNRRLVMHNDFIIVGPPSDPAGIRGLSSAPEAFKKIAAAEAVFVSRGDDSGTHKKEKEIWAKTSIQPGGRWYQEAGSGMGQTLNIASEKEGYTLTDRGTYLALKKRLGLEVLVQGDAMLLNIYHVMQVNPEKFDKVNGPGAKAFVDFMVAPDTQKVIASFGVKDYGEPLFFADAGKSEDGLGR